MSTVFTWSINGVRKDQGGGVYMVNWRVDATDTHASLPKEIKKSGVLTFAPNPESPDFIPFESLTQEQVLSWVYGRIDKDFIEMDLDQVVQSFVSSSSDDWVPLP